MFRVKLHIDFHEKGILSEVTALSARPFEVYEEQVHDDNTVTFRIDAREHREEFYARLRTSEQVVEVSKVGDSHLLIRKQAMGALPIIRENHGKMQGIDRVYGTKRILDVVVFRLADLRRIMTDLRAISDASIGKLLPIDDPTSRLTERQQTVMHHALERGYYDWPRSVDARGLARDLDISHTTLLEHLRKAERTLLEAAFVDERTTPSPHEREYLLSTN